MFDGILRLWSSRLKLHSQLYLNNCRSFSYPGPLRCVILQTANQLSCMKGHILETDIQFLQLVENSFVISLKKKNPSFFISGSCFSKPMSLSSSSGGAGPGQTKEVHAESAHQDAPTAVWLWRPACRQLDGHHCDLHWFHHTVHPGCGKNAFLFL